MKGDIRCVDGRRMRHDPQFDDPELETDIGECEECGGKGHNCEDCLCSHAEEHWDMRPWLKEDTYLCEQCANTRRDRYLEGSLA